MNRLREYSTGYQLWCKPPASEAGNHILYSKQHSAIQDRLSIRSLNLDTDLDIIHSWMNQSYAQRFWQLTGSTEVVAAIYKGILKNLHAHTFIALVGEKPVALIDLYATLTDELADHIKVTDGCGMHLLMCPPREMQKGWSLAVLKSFQEFYFGFPESQWLFAEPDVQNIPANNLALKAGFTLLRTIQLSYKTANLYAIHRNDFIKSSESKTVL